ncbi:MAG: flavin monoamine oxidase family protein [Gammaproteobacteria bacterium]
MIASDVIIVGGGLTGRALADHLHRNHRDVHLIEARDRFGGRIQSRRMTADDVAGWFDLGPSWFWPGQPLMQSLLTRFDLDHYAQCAEGLGCYQTPDGLVQRGVGYATMRGSLRVAGGMSALILALAATLPSRSYTLDHPIASLRNTGKGVELVDADEKIFARARRVVLAMPPRLAAGLHFDPPLPASCLQSLVTVPTWMAGQAKLVAVYKSAFWRDRGLSGDAMSQSGPLAEVHDATDETAGVPALFGFVGASVSQRRGRSETLVSAAIEQLAVLFGEGADKPVAVEFKDWALDPLTAVESDHIALTGHPEYGQSDSHLDPWPGALWFGSTELGLEFGGYLEGALQRAKVLADQLV